MQPKNAKKKIKKRLTNGPRDGIIIV